MKYKELIQFEPINEVVRFDQLKNDSYIQSLVRNFVFSDTYEKTFIPRICKNLDYTSTTETFGLQIVGNYGTGKSHLMSLISLIAENAELLPLVQNDSVRKVLGNIAGKYKVIRFELGSDQELWKLVANKVDEQFAKWSITHSLLNDNANDMYKDKLGRMLAAFENQFPNKGLMIVIDEMLSYLKGRSGSADLNRDLAVLQALGEFSDHSKFRMIFGVQELIYKSPEFQFAAQTLQKANDRYIPIEITKQEVQYVVQQRLLRKDDNQRAAIKAHLSKFTQFFTDMHANLDTYVNLFPVNPSFFENFQQIRIGKSQREILKTLSRKFETLLENDVPSDQPGLICYDSYWNDLLASDMQTNADIRRVTEIMTTVHQKIDENLTGARAKKAALAHRIADACAIKILQDDLTKTNGANPESLVDDLCYIDSSIIDRELLLDTITTTAKQIVTATVGQYFEQNKTNQEFHLRVEGGVNYEQKIKDFVATMSDDVKDSYFFNYLVEFLPIAVEQYKKGFKIYQHRLNWKSHNITLDGYIFMGNPNERSTTQPQQNFYIYFMPVFNKAKIKHGDEPDSVYFHLDKISHEAKALIELYAASESLIASVDSSQKSFYQHFRDSYINELKPLFNNDFIQQLEVYYQGSLQTIPQVSPAMSKDEMVSNIAAGILEDYFCSTLKDYPAFKLLRTTLTNENKNIILKGARAKIANPNQPFHDGEAILVGLGLLSEGKLSTDTSIYAQSVRQRLEDKGQGQVLNRDEILHRFYKDWSDDWRSNDYNISSELEFIVLLTMVAMGEIEIALPGKTVNATNLKDFVDISVNETFLFTHVSRPKSMNILAVRELLMGITGKDLTPQLHNPQTYADLLSQAQQIARSAVKAEHDIANGISIDTVEVISPLEADKMKIELKALAGLCDKVQNYSSEAKLRNLPWTADEIKNVLKAKALIDTIAKTQEAVTDLRMRINYLNTAVNYMTDTAMKNDAKSLIDCVTDIVSDISDEAKINAFKTKIDSFISSYADWYLGEYRRLHITEMENTQKNVILQSNEKKACDAIANADSGSGYLSLGSDFAQWSTRIQQLTPVGNVTKNMLLSSPSIAGFDPNRFIGKQLPTLESLKDEIQTLFERANDALHEIFSDKSLKANIDLVLDDTERALANRFSSNAEPLAPANAERLVEIIKKLHQGIHPVNITQNDLRTIFNRPMTPDEAIKTFRNHINTLVGDGNKDNIRIIFK